MQDKSWARINMPRIGLVVSDFNYDITSLMHKKAEEQSELLGFEHESIRVPGVFDMPLAVKLLLKKKSIDGVALIGAVIKGETRHDDLVINQSVRKIVDLSNEYEKPVTIGIIGPGAEHDQAVARIEEYSTRAVESLAKLLKAFKKN
ncbi:MAG: 6,7-dimethyl-8-ribityllumazine synthase [Candidatus Thermoplasmatota archaeon]|jgi:6,7-dimethyl-8-ribityllumazine synthase|nr:6,7-dimethyl-8-ribityllumazine synthase [Candidatus Thermoplasmatota archaeon]